MMPSNARDGLAWDDRGLDLKPVWTREPSLEAIAKVCREKLRIDEAGTCKVLFHAKGGFNKIYLVHTSQQQWIMRVSLPVCPRNKTQGEVTTLQFLRHKTTVPVPGVVAFDDSAENEIGFEWILMEFMPGESAYKRWRTLAMPQKIALVRQVAEFQAQIFRHEFSEIGTLVGGKGESNQEERPGEVISNMFFWGSHYDYDVTRGPFRSSHDWLAAYLEFITQGQIEALGEAEDEEDEEDINFAMVLARRLISLLPKIFPTLETLPERMVIWHDDLSLSNILVDDEGKITAVIDWECVSAMPRWLVTQVPRFLEGQAREKEPERQDYADEAPEDEKDNELDNEGKNELYWIHLMEYEQTQLRRVYHERMSQLQPDWDATAKQSTLKEDFFNAVNVIRDGFFLKRTAKWIDAVERGECPRLMDILEEGLRL
ncbi:phosphotransferase enzyme family domain-containing protein [Trichoderma evansii]